MKNDYNVYTDISENNFIMVKNVSIFSKNQRKLQQKNPT